MAEITKDKAVKAERVRLGKLFAEIDENKRNFVDKKIDDLAWLSVTIKELQTNIDRDGNSLEYNNGGGQSGVRTNPEVQTLNTYIKLSNEITKILIDLVPAKTKASKLAAFAE